MRHGSGYSVRTPHPPKVLLAGLTPEQQKQVILLALEVVYELGAGREWGAMERIEFANMDTESYIGFWSLLNSEQRSTIKQLQQTNHDMKVKHD